MPVIGMIGPHAVGKTTALKRWAERYNGLITVSLDVERSAYPDNEAKQALVKQCQTDNRVWVLESARGFAAWVGAFKATDPVIVLTCPEPVGRQWISDRRVAKGKPAELGPYWTERRLDYECNGHLLNYVKKKLHPDQVKHFVIEDRARDWPAADDYFGLLYRRLRNAANRRVSSGA